MGFFDDVDVNEVLKKSEENQESSCNSFISKEQPTETNADFIDNNINNVEEISEEESHKETTSASTSTSLEGTEDDGSFLMDELLPKEQDYIGENEAQLPGESNDVLNDSSFTEPILQTAEELKASEEIKAPEENNINVKDKEAQIKKEEKALRSKQPKKMETSDNPASYTFICANTTINGDISTDCPISIYGAVKGTVSSLDKIFVSEGAKTGGLETALDVVIKGSVNGNVKASNVEILEEGKVFKGNISCDDLIVSESAIVIGDVKAEQSVIIAGAVKGNIESNNKVYLKSTAIIQGNITSASIVIEDGAAIEGTCTQAYAKVKPADFFKDIKLEENEA